ncbi:MAG TPA: hypothetical protein PKH10_10000 [bacterium]|nr:hypothetical protein [bacterium]
MRTGRPLIFSLLLLHLSSLSFPAAGLLNDAYAFAAGNDRLLPSPATDENTAAIYHRETLTELNFLRSDDDADDPPSATEISDATAASSNLALRMTAPIAAFPCGSASDILHVSPKHSPPLSFSPA